MKEDKQYLSNNFQLLEIVFFTSYFILFPVFTAIEYNLNESYKTDLSTHVVLEDIIYGCFNIFPALFYYKVIIPRLLFLKKYWLFCGAIIIYLFLYNIYMPYLVYWPLSQFNFLPAPISENANKYFHAKVFSHFSIIYMFRELLVLTALAYFIKSARQEKLMNQLREIQLNTELNYLKAQIQPHFFFNTLNNVYALALQKSDDTAPLVAKLSELMRYILYDSMQPKIQIWKEVDFLRNYIEVESVRYNGKIKISFDAQGINDTYKIEPLLLLPFVENAFKHGIQEETKAGYVNVVVCLIEQELTLDIKNSKMARQYEEDNSGGIGHSNILKRLSLLYPGKHKLDIREDISEYEVLLTLQLS